MMQSHISKTQRLQIDLPWTLSPLVSNAPMSVFAGSDLAVAVTQSGGLGYIGYTGTPRRLQHELKHAQTLLRGSNVKASETDIIPVGVGIIALDDRVDEWTRVFTKFKPAAVWLSFGSSEQFLDWTTAVREASPSTKIWIQIGSVKTALETAQLCHPDVLVLQGSDAGGHGHKDCASLITLLPETSDVMRRHGFGNLPLIAAGGIMDGRSGAAAFSLGASGLVLGTRFLGAEETIIEPEIREEIFRAVDGGLSTARSRVWDDIWGANSWPELYDGRCLRNAMYNDLQEGLNVSEIRNQLQKRIQAGNSSPALQRDISTIWSGTGVGMVKRLEKAADIVKQLQLETKKRTLEISETV